MCGNPRIGEELSMQCHYYIREQLLWNQCDLQGAPSRAKDKIGGDLQLPARRGESSMNEHDFGRNTTS